MYITNSISVLSPLYFFGSLAVCCICMAARFTLHVVMIKSFHLLYYSVALVSFHLPCYSAALVSFHLLCHSIALVSFHLLCYSVALVSFHLPCYYISLVSFHLLCYSVALVSFHLLCDCIALASFLPLSLSDFNTVNLLHKNQMSELYMVYFYLLWQWKMMVQELHAGMMCGIKYGIQKNIWPQRDKV
jgi:hypothetical protein